MKAWIAVLLAVLLLWLGTKVPWERRGLDSVAAALQGALEQDPVCAVIFGWEEPSTAL